MSPAAGASLVVFADARSHVSLVLAEAALRAARGRADLAAVTVCDVARSRPEQPLARAAGRVARGTVARLLDPAQELVLHPSMARSLGGIARRAGASLVVPPARDVNEPGFVSGLAGLRPAFALSLHCGQIFRRPLLDVFEGAANYHDGLLPAYRGVYATAWSVYRGDAATGFSFHRMTERLDEGPVLAEETIPVRPEASVQRLGLEKAVRACASVELVLDALLRGAAGRAQTGAARLYRWSDLHAVRRVPDPESLTWDELRRRLRAFGVLRASLGGEDLPVTRLRPGGRGRLSFTTLDGVRAEACRLAFLTPGLYRARRWTAGRARHRG